MPPLDLRICLFDEFFQLVLISEEQQQFVLLMGCSSPRVWADGIFAQGGSKPKSVQRYLIYLLVSQGYR